MINGKLACRKAVINVFDMVANEKWEILVGRGKNNLKTINLIKTPSVTYLLC